MCGIAGFFSKSGFIKPEEITVMTNCLAHRGPDADGNFTENGIALGHRRLSILDLSTAANQPMLSANERFVIAFNGEVYNYKEIATELGLITKTTSDTEVLLEAFAKVGEQFIHKCNGMFAIVLYDRQTQDLYIYRDRMGIKPVYYYWDGDNFAFASELKALRALPNIKAKLSLDKVALNNYLHLEYIPAPRSIYNEIKKQPAGTYIKLSKGVLTVNTYWKLEDKITDNLEYNELEAKNKLRELLESSVRYRMISDVPFGTFLSGGTDSSVVTAVAQSISPTPVNTFTIGFNNEKFNERPYAEAVAKHLGTNHHEMVVDYADALALVDRVVDAYDEPMSDSSAINTMLVSKMARQHVTMTLAGDGGDELFLGYGMYTWAQRLSDPVIKSLRKPIGIALGLGNNRFKRAAQLFNYENQTEVKSHIYSQEQYVFSQTELPQILHSNYFTGIELNQATGNVARKLTPVEEQAIFDMKYYLKDDLLVKVDRASMQYALETRVPLLDYRIVEFSLNLYQGLKIKGGTTKYLLKQVLYDYVPKQLFDRPKWGFAVPMAQWFKQELEPMVRETLSEKKTNDIGLLNYTEVQSLVNRFYTGEDYLYKKLWQLILLHKWAEKNMP